MSRTPSYEYEVLHQFEAIFRDGEHKTQAATRDYQRVWENVINNPPEDGVTPVVVYRMNGRTCAAIAGLDDLVDNEECAMEIARLAARVAELEAEVAVLSGTACAEEQAEGNGPCGACRTCRNKRIAELEAENAKLKESVERMVRIYHEQRTELDNTREERNNAQYEAVEAKAENTKLRKCVEAADRILLSPDGGIVDEYEAARAEVDNG